MFYKREGRFNTWREYYIVTQGYDKAKKFVATQGPLPNTIEDFWFMVWEQKCEVIVMLTKCEEGKKVALHLPFFVVEQEAKVWLSAFWIPW